MLPLVGNMVEDCVKKAVKEIRRKEYPLKNVRDQRCAVVNTAKKST